MKLDRVIIVRFEDSEIEGVEDSETVRIMTAAEAAEFFVGMAFMRAMEQQEAQNEAEASDSVEVSNADILGGSF